MNERKTFEPEDIIGFAADELPVHYRGGVGKSEKGRVGRWESVSLDIRTWGLLLKLVSTKFH